VVRHLCPHSSDAVGLPPWPAVADDDKWSGELERSQQDTVLQKRQLGLAGEWRIRATMPKTWGMRRIVETHRHSRGSQRFFMAMFSSPCGLNSSDNTQGLHPPHMEGATMSGTGTRQPSRCGKGPKAVGESVRVLPGKPPGDAVRLVCKGPDLSLWWQSRHSSLSAGKPRTGRRTAGQGTVGIQRTWSSRLLPLMASGFVGPYRKEVSVKTALTGKPDAVKAARPVWRGALRNRSPRKEEEALPQPHAAGSDEP